MVVTEDLSKRLESACLPLVEEWLADVHESDSDPLRALPDDDLRIYGYLLVRKVVALMGREVGVEVALDGAREDYKDQFLASMTTLADAMDDEVLYTVGRSKRVEQLAARLAAMAGLSDPEIADVEHAARIANIGMINANQQLINQPRLLTAEELSIARNHSQVGADILKPIECLGEIAAMVRYHHANWDGTGYPLGVDGEQIPRGARMIRIADALEAMTAERPHRAAMTRGDAVIEILKDSGKAFDPGLTKFANAMQ